MVTSVVRRVMRPAVLNLSMLGKEKRKKKGGKEGKLGVEGMSPQQLLESLRRCGATFEGEERVRQSAGITNADLLDKGLIGPGSAEKRASLVKKLKLPQHISTEDCWKR